jgi:hypothetical protein
MEKFEIIAGDAIFMAGTVYDVGGAHQGTVDQGKPLRNLY